MQDAKNEARQFLLDNAAIGGDKEQLPESIDSFANTGVYLARRRTAEPAATTPMNREPTA